MRLHEMERDGLVEGRMSRTVHITPAGRIFVRAVAQTSTRLNRQPWLRKPYESHAPQGASLEQFMITMEKILCPADFFPASDEAVTYAAGLAANYDASIHLLHVVTPIAAGTYEYAIDTDEIMRSMEEKSMEQLNKLVARVKKAGVAVTSELRTGDVYEEIKGSIVDVKPDLIVMGTHGQIGRAHV